MRTAIFKFLKVNKTFPIITLSVPVVLLILLVRMPTFGRRELSTPECQVKKWDIPVLLRTKNKAPVLIPRSPVSCCQGDMSCGDEALFTGSESQLPDKKILLQSIDRSLEYLQTDRADAAYKGYEVPGVTRVRVQKSLLVFRQLLLKSKSASELNLSIQREFVLYQSIGKDKKGSVLFTAYYEPLYAASRTSSPEYRYPIYKLPADIDSWVRPHPTRSQLEGIDGLQADKGKLRGLELFWFRDRLEPYIMQIQGSARLQLTDGTQTTVGYAGNTAYNYKSIGKELADDGKLPLEGMTMPVILDYFQKYPQELNIYIPRDPSFVFFQENYGAPAQGSIKVPLSPERSIATDKSIMPPGALALIRADFPFVNFFGKITNRVVSRYVLDQDTGGAINGAGRVDYFLGTGKVAGDRAGVTVSDGQLYYLLLKPQK